jgi:hypothetical protein
MRMRLGAAIALAAALAALWPALASADGGAAASSPPAAAPGTSAAEGPPSASTSTDETSSASNGPDASEGATPADAAGAPAATQETASEGAPEASAPTSASDQAAAVGQTAAADAVAAQQGDAPAGGTGAGSTYGHGAGQGNVQTDVRVDQPGNGDGATQANLANAEATATASAAIDAPGGAAEVAQAASASATAAQTDVDNVQLTVRVDSPGDDGPVTQVNAAGATSSAGVELETTPGTDVLAAGDSQAAATATQDGVGNTTVSVRVFSPGDDGPVTQLNEAQASATADAASATAVQDGTRNTYVGVRVESPGDRGPVAQASEAAASAPGGAITVDADGLDTTVIADIAAPELELPAATTVWEWHWVWEGDEAGFDEEFLVDGTSWDWSWGVPAGEARARQATANELPGTWNWTWNWDRDVPGWAWNWAQSSELACATCIWIWTWDWRWSGEPKSVAAGETPHVSSNGSFDQRTSVVATASAEVSTIIVQEVQQDGVFSEQFAGQIALVAQDGDASALTTQLLASAGDDTGADRAVSAASVVHLLVDTDQWIRQGGVLGPGELTQWAGQQVEIAQVADAFATAGQATAPGASGRTAADASVAVAAASRQAASQHGAVDDGLLSQWIGQLTTIVQIGRSESGTSQLGRDAVARRAVARSAASDLALVDQAAFQDGARGDGVGSQSIAQLVQIGQDATAVAATAQAADENAARFASSDAESVNRTLVLQTGMQAMAGSSALDVQELVQELLVVQAAFAASASSGGIAGLARAVNCSTTDQGAGQAIGSSVTVPVVDQSAFCAPPSPLATTDPGPDTTVESAAGTTFPLALPVPESLPDEDIAVPHGYSRGRLSGRALVERTIAPSGRSEIAPVRVDAQTAAAEQTSLPPAPPQARLDTRPEGGSEARAVVRESPLPATDDPPAGWVMALAEAGAAAPLGASGIATILAALALVPPLLRRARDGAAVRRPRSVLIPIDVPV